MIAQLGTLELKRSQALFDCVSGERVVCPVCGCTHSRREGVVSMKTGDSVFVSMKIGDSVFCTSVRRGACASFS